MHWPTGTRAEREFEELREDFRERTAQQFSEEVEGLRDDAVALDQEQQRISERLDELREEEERSLRDTGERQDLVEGLEGQREDLQEILERMQDLVEQAEEPEPLLAEKLYETVRETQHSRTEQALDKIAEQLLDRGFLQESAGG